jgi:ABC-2 type transport system permease protein
MTLVDKGFRAYGGARTPSPLRFLVVSRYALADAVRTRKVIGLLVAAMVIPLLAAVLIYLRHNVEALSILPTEMTPFVQKLAIDGNLFYRLLQIQSVPCFFLFLVSGATLVSQDLRDNALPLYLSRPLTRTEYVAGKATVLAVLGSAVTWVPLAVLILLQASLAGTSWLLEQWRLPFAVFAGSWVILAVLTFVCLAMSALLRAKAAAEGAFLSIFLLTPLLALSINETLDTELGTFVHLRTLVNAVERGIFGLEALPEMGPVAAAVALGVLLVVCAGILGRKIRAYEVVK